LIGGAFDGDGLAIERDGPARLTTWLEILSDPTGLAVYERAPRLDSRNERGEPVFAYIFNPDKSKGPQP
jgi:hypothetical protein